MDYDRIYRRIDANMLDEALSVLYDEGTDSIVPAYSGDLNHSWYIVGDIRFKLRQFDKALSAFRRALSERPEDVDALMACASASEAMNDPKSAEMALRRALEICPRNASYAYNLGNALFDQERYADAIRYYESISVMNSELASKAKANADACRRQIQRLKRDSRCRRT